MTSITKDDLTALFDYQNEFIVSMYMPMEKLGREIRENAIQLKNQLAVAREQLEMAGMTRQEIDELLAEVIRLIENQEFWRHQDKGLAIFVTPDETKIWRLPLSFEPLTTVGERAHVKPLLDYFAYDGRYFILALSQKDVRFFRGTRYSIQEIDVEGMPRSLDEALQYDDPESHLQYHTTPKTRGNSGDALYHGHGDVEIDDKTQILRFCQKVDHALQPFLAQENAPLILACVDYMLPIYKEANSYNHILTTDHISGNPKLLTAALLHEQAMEILDPVFTARREEAWDIYQQAQATEQTVSGAIDVAQAAYQGRVQTAFVARNEHWWGQVDEETGQVTTEDEPTPNNVDVLDFAAAHTLKNGGEVYLVDTDNEELPLDESAAAVLRF